MQSIISQAQRSATFGCANGVSAVGIPEVRRSLYVPYRIFSVMLTGRTHFGTIENELKIIFNHKITANQIHQNEANKIFFKNYRLDFYKNNCNYLKFDVEKFPPLTLYTNLAEFGTIEKLHAQTQATSGVVTLYI